ncbi:MAG: hypothetical protein HPY52_01380 [Firmicutes bacterium]|nr:hypothetical protein [Bacillota bacterium]
MGRAAAFYTTQVLLLISGNFAMKQIVASVGADALAKEAEETGWRKRT